MTTLLFNRSGCAGVRVRLGPYLDGQLRGAGRQRVESHVGACANCSAELQRLRALRDELRRGLTVSPSGRDAELFWEKVERKIAGATSRRRGIPDRAREVFRRYPTLAWGSAAALGVVIALFAGDLLLRPTIRSTTTGAPSDGGPRTVIESVEGGPNSSVFLLTTPDQQVKIIWVLEQERS
jgi:anti-sigma factor RsiW